MPRFLTSEDAAQLERLLDQTMEECDGNLHLYRQLERVYHSFEPQSNTAAAVAEIARVVGLVNPGRAAQILGFVSIRIRQTNYPSAWNLLSTQARDAYRNTHAGTSALFWKCPGHGRVPHDAAITDITIDHVMPVATHWNTTGHNTDRISRINWYYDTTNHAYLCQSCNSSRGSGGVLYSIVTGPLYSN